MFNLKGRKALVTGGRRGIGFAIAKQLAKSGADIIPDFPYSSGAFETDLIVYSLWRQFKPVLLF